MRQVVIDPSMKLMEASVWEVRDGIVCRYGSTSKVLEHCRELCDWQTGKTCHHCEAFLQGEVWGQFVEPAVIISSLEGMGIHVGEGSGEKGKPT